MKTIVGIMGPGRTSDTVLETAYALGLAIAENGWVLLTGGRSTGVMDESMRGAKKAGGLTLGILPDHDISDASKYIDVPVITGIGSARNMINILSSRVVVACGTGLGTTSEVALALKTGKPVILIQQTKESINFFGSFNMPNLYLANTVDEVIGLIKEHIQ